MLFLSLATNARRKELTKAYSGYNLGSSAAWCALSFSRNERKTQRINKKLIPVTILAAQRLGVLFPSLAKTRRRKELTKAHSGYNLGGSAAWRALSFSRKERETQRINKKLIPVTNLAAQRLGVIFLSPRFCSCLGWFSIFFSLFLPIGIITKNFLVTLTRKYYLCDKMNSNERTT